MSKVVTSVIGFIFLFICVVAAVTMYTSSSKEYIPNTPQSIDKMTKLNEAFRSALGPKWPYVLLVFTILLGLALWCLYMATATGMVNITLNDTDGHRIGVVLTYLTIIFGISMILMSYKQYQKYKNQQENGADSNYAPSAETEQQQQQILIVIGLLLFVLLGGGYAAWYLFFRKSGDVQVA
jgi:flagellar basal body-associated protein FliL